HGQRRETKAGAVEIVEEIGDGQKRHEAQRRLPDRALQQGFRGGRIGSGNARDVLRECHRLFPCPRSIFLFVAALDNSATPRASTLAAAAPGHTTASDYFFGSFGPTSAPSTR